MVVVSTERLPLVIPMTKEETALYAGATAHMISVRGEEPLARVLAMLRGLDVAEDEAASVVAHGLANALFTEDPATGALKARPSAPGDALRRPREDGQKSAQWIAELERRSELLEVLLDVVPLAIWSSDRDGVISLLEGRGAADAGVTAEQLVGANVLEVLSVYDWVGEIRQALAGQRKHLFTEYANVPWELWCVPLKDERGEVRSLIGISLNITESKRTENELRSKIQLIERQRQVIRELSTPIIEVWNKVLMLPLVGVVDSGRSADVMESLLMRVAQTGARFAILDLTGVEAMDTSTASHLFKLIQAIRLLGAEGIITGIQPSVAQTMVALGVDMEGIVTLATMRSGLQFCMRAARAAPGVLAPPSDETGPSQGSADRGGV
jgi:anti-anti-sigma regulatory factor/PAS domain-containing protein